MISLGHAAIIVGRWETMELVGQVSRANSKENGVSAWYPITSVEKR